MTHADTEQRDDYPAIGSLAAIGDGRSLALLTPDGTVPWFCPARFDGPPLLWSLLDQQKGGFLRIAPIGPVASAMRYLDETAVVEYVWTTRSGTARAQVCMEWPGPHGQQRLLWLITGVSGKTEIDVDLFPQPDFGRAGSHIQPRPEAVHIQAGNYPMAFQGGTPALAGNHVRGRVCVEAGETAVFCLALSMQPDVEAETVPLSSVAQRVEGTAAAWRAWATTIKWENPYRGPVIRSAITLKLLIYEPSGAVVAAGTTSLPEAIGGARNWDYRFTWFRDAGLVLDALYSLGCHQEAHRWAEWMQNTVMSHQMPLQVLYAVDGELPPCEDTLPQVDGYRQSRPVRTGNAADGQFQLDIYGELLECVFICDTMNDDAMGRHWEHLRQAADYIATHWREPDHGIWEVRSDPKHFVHSKVAAWAGLERALWLQGRHTLDCDSDLWRKEATAIKNDVLQHGISKDGTRFMRAYDDPEPDASLLLLARYGFVEGTDVVFQNTVNAIWSKLGIGDGRSGLLRRYAGGGNDGLAGEEGAFTICSFWLVDALVRGKRTAEARNIFNRLLSVGGTSGLYAEQIDPVTGEHLGNFPQAFSHVGVINAALQLANGSPELHHQYQV